MFWNKFYSQKAASGGLLKFRKRFIHKKFVLFVEDMLQYKKNCRLRWKSMAFVEFENVGKTYRMGEMRINALHDASFSVEKGELVVIVGP